MEKYDVVLVNAPFMRFCGSHNDKAPVSLAYLSSFLEESGTSHIVYNADYTGAQSYWKWKWMFDNFESFVDAVDNKGSLYGEVVENIMSFSPKVVVVMGGEILFPTTDLGNPYIAGNLSKRLRKLGVFTIGIGPFFTMQPQKFKDYFDAIFLGEPSKEIVQVIKQKKIGIIKSSGLPVDVSPNFKGIYPAGQKVDNLMTSFGCAFNCSFCPVSKVSKGVRYVDPKVVVEDLKTRMDKKIYIADLNFPYSAEHLKKLKEEFRKNKIEKEFTIDARVDCIDEKRIELLKDIGVKTVKIGIEGMTDKQLKIFNKKIKGTDTLKAIKLLKKAGMKVIGYFIIGGPEIFSKDYKVTIGWLKKLGLDYMVINIWAYDLRTDYRYDTHFSPYALKRWKLPKKIFYQYLELQQSFNPTVGKLIG